MAIPDYQSIMLPLLKYLSDQKEHSLRETIDDLAKVFSLTEEEQKESYSVPIHRKPLLSCSRQVMWLWDNPSFRVRCSQV